ncbi:phasin family protein [Parafrankia sp. BMG5.11]|uniref:phasin family protein n=1 Tax=Parafrankia sp. BMG5.11 TaxID=222540 RepID=UPI00103AF16F|nr:phasin family protein [Parafrankia sp. BMG5.11]TCJ40921.1 phasin family protein [Parafrankia sp. BMG5.11]
MADAADDQGQNVKAVAVEAPKADATIDAATTDTSKIALAVAGMKTSPAKATGKSGRKFSAAKAARKSDVPVTSTPDRAAQAAPTGQDTIAAPQRAIPTISQLKDKIMETTTTQTTEFTQGIKNTAAQAQERAKAAYDRLQTYAGEMTEFTKGNVEALVESGKIVGTGVQDMARDEIEAAKGAFETLTADLKAMAAVKSPTELFKLQGEIARRNFDAAVARASRNAEVSVKLVNDAFAPISTRMSVAAERMNVAA